MKELVKIQGELKAPKGQMNKFGGYKYRSAEDILEAVKPLLTKYECFLTLSDSVVMIGDRYYVEATATITNSEGNSVSTKALAREEETKKGMDGSQLSGSSSSYSRKYALNGLLCIDDTKDADTDEYCKRTATATAPKAEDIQKEMSEALKELQGAGSKEAVVEVWKKHAKLQGFDKFREAVKIASNNIIE